MRRKRSLLAILVVLTGLLTVSSPANANEQLELVAEGLDNPRGISVLGNRVFVAESGRGGETLVEVAIGGGPGPVCVGNTGAISEIVNGVAETRIELPSYVDAIDGACEGPGFGTNATGPHGVVAADANNLIYTVGLGGNPTSRAPLEAAAANADELGSVMLARRGTSSSRDLAAFEEAADPDGAGADSNPTALSGDRERRCWSQMPERTHCFRSD